MYVALAQLKDDRRSHLVNQYKNYLKNLRFRNNQYVVNGGQVALPQQGQQQQMPQQQVQVQAQQQVKRVGKLGKEEETINIAGQPPLTTNKLASANPQEQKQMLGERLYPLISNIYPE